MAPVLEVAADVSEAEEDEDLASPVVLVSDLAAEGLPALLLPR